MGNNYFEFKQFKVQQEHCSMKVCTDACLFGAWVAEQMQNEKEKINNILDIGAGTGLLSLMLAQKLNAHTDAVEIDEPAALQAKANFEVSSWSNRLNVCNTSIQNFRTETSYDLIISNPPFFERSLKSENRLKNIAKHAGALTLEELVDVALKLLTPQGKFCVLLPPAEFKKFEMICGDNDLFLIQRADVQQTPTHSFFRTMGIFSRQFSTPSCEVIVIKDEHNSYTSTFKNLLKDYYLYL